MDNMLILQANNSDYSFFAVETRRVNNYLNLQGNSADYFGTQFKIR